MRNADANRSGFAFWGTLDLPRGVIITCTYGRMFNEALTCTSYK